MTNNDVLAVLLAGLERDEAVALAAAPVRDTRWIVDADGELFSVSGPLEGRCSEHEPGQPNMCDDSPIGPDPDFDPQGHIAAHMERQQPARTLRRVTAYRKVLDEHRQANGQCEVCRDYDFHRTYDPVPWPCPTVRALAEIYTETDGVPNAED